jgi:GT2 family glycosyltransferase
MPAKKAEERTMGAVPIIIPFYREHEKLKKCMAAIQGQSHAAGEVFVRDNTNDNILFTAAVNEGLARFCYRPDVDYVIVLNQDAYMHKDCVRHLVQFMDAHPECGIACPLQYEEVGGGMRWGGPGTTLTVGGSKAVTWGGSLQAFPFGVHRTDDFASYREPFETFWANGACMMIRTQVVREVGVFDKNMRFICSDSDFSFTARARGWKIHVVPQALAQHALGASAAANPEISLVKCRDAIYFTEKWLTGGLYRQLAFEGKELPAIGVRQWLAKLRREVQALERRLGTGAGARPADYPSWVTEFQQAMPPRRSGRF